MNVLIFRGNEPAKLAFELESPIVGLERVGKNYIVACMDKTLTSFTTKVRLDFNPLSPNSINWSNTLQQFVGNLLTSCLSVFEHFVGLAFKGLK